MTAPWATGPGEILQHGISLLGEDTDANRRLALLSIDNAVELMLKTYLNLPKRVTGIKLSRKEYVEVSESFPLLLDTVERVASNLLTGINLGEIEWFHRLRNELYHQGNGLTVERAKVEAYAQLGKLLFQNLFGESIEVREGQNMKIVGEFLDAYISLEKRAYDLVKGSKRQKMTTPFSFRELHLRGVIDSNTKKEIEYFRSLRNQLVHGQLTASSQVNRGLVGRLKAIVDKLPKRDLVS